MSINVLTFDPGKNTGWSWWKDGTLHNVGVAADLDQVVYIMNALGPTCTHVVYEGFARANAAAHDQIMTMEMCGAIMGLARHHDCELVKQYPAVRRGYLQFAKAMGKGIPSDVRRHAVDAIAHGLKFHDTLAKETDFKWDRPF
jgi:hypothetical protein